MTAFHEVAVLVGSLRKDGYSSRLAQTLIHLAPSSLSLATVGIGDLPLYNQDLDNSPPAPWEAFRRAIRPASAVLFVTPEYNRSVPGVLKNAIDVASRPYGQSVFDGKPAAVVSQSPGALGGFGANHALRQSLVFLNMPTLPTPEAYISHSSALFDDAGALKDDGAGKFLAAFMVAFSAWIEVYAAVPAVRTAS